MLVERCRRGHVRSGRPCALRRRRGRPQYVLRKGCPHSRAGCGPIASRKLDKAVSIGPFDTAVTDNIDRRLVPEGYHPHRRRGAQRPRPSGPVRRRPRSQRRDAADPSARAPPMALEGRSTTGPRRAVRYLRSRVSENEKTCSLIGALTHIRVFFNLLIYKEFTRSRGRPFWW